MRTRPIYCLFVAAAVAAALPACDGGKGSGGTGGNATGGRASTGGQPGTGGGGTGGAGTGGAGTGGQAGTGGMGTGGVTATGGVRGTGGAPAGGASAGSGGTANGGVGGSTSPGAAGAGGGGRAWMAATALTPQAGGGPYNDGSVDVAVNADGEGVVTWLRGASVVARRYHGSTGTWDDEKVVGGTATPDGTDVGIDAAGNALVVWTDEGSASNLGIWWSRSPAGGSTWSAPRRLTATQFMTPPSLAVAANGVALLAWGENISDRMTVRACDFRNGEWNATINLPKAGTSGDETAPRVALDASGKGFLTWSQYSAVDQAVRRVYVQRYDSGWQTPVTMLDDTDTTDLDKEAVVPSVALNAAGVGVALWVERTWGITPVDSRLWARRFDGTKWLPQEIVARGTFEFTPPGPQAAAGADGTLVGAWGQVQATAYQACAARFTPGASGWEVARSVETTNLAAANPNRDWVTPRLGVDGKGNATMLWRKKVDAPPRVVPTTSRLVAGAAAWDPDNGIPLRDDGASSISTLGIAVAGNGTALAVWSYGKSAVWASVYK